MTQCGSKWCVSPDTYCDIPFEECRDCGELCNPRNFATQGENHLGSCLTHCKEFYDTYLHIKAPTDEPQILTETVSEPPVFSPPNIANSVDNSSEWNINTSLLAVIGTIVLLVLIGLILLGVYLTKKDSCKKIIRKSKPNKPQTVIYHPTNQNIPGDGAGDIIEIVSEDDHDDDDGNTTCRILIDSSQRETTQVKTTSSKISQESPAATGSDDDDDVVAAAMLPSLFSHRDPDVTVATTYPPEEDKIWYSNNGAQLQHPAGEHEMNGEETRGFSHQVVGFKRVRNEMEQGVSSGTSGYGSAGLNRINSIS